VLALDSSIQRPTAGQLILTIAQARRIFSNTARAGRVTSASRPGRPVDVAGALPLPRLTAEAIRLKDRLVDCAKPARSATTDATRLRTAIGA
jgi:hypothetical protein